MSTLNRRYLPAINEWSNHSQFGVKKETWFDASAILKCSFLIKVVATGRSLNLNRGIPIMLAKNLNQFNGRRS